MAVAVTQNDTVVWTQGFGLADVEQQVPVRPDTVFRIASISKSITATAVMQLVERGLVSLEDPIQRFVPSFPKKPQGDVRVRHLLTNTSGVRHYKGSEFSLTEPFATLERAPPCSATTRSSSRRASANSTRPTATTCCRA